MWFLPSIQTKTLTNESTGRTTGFRTNTVFAEPVGEISALPSTEVIDNLLSIRDLADRLRPPLRRLIYELITLTVANGASVSRNGTDNLEITKTTNNNSWNGEARSTQGFSAPITMEFDKRADVTDNGVSYMTIGWNADPTTDTNYTSIDHASYPYQQQQYVVYNNGAISNHRAWRENRKFYLTYTRDGRILHWNGSTLLYSANYNLSTAAHIDSSFYSVNSTFATLRNFRVIKAEWNGTNYVA